MITSINDYHEHPVIPAYLDTLKNKITTLHNEIHVLKTDLEARNKPSEQPQAHAAEQLAPEPTISHVFKSNLP